MEMQIASYRNAKIIPNEHNEGKYMTSKFPVTGTKYNEVLSHIQTVCNRDASFREGHILNSICSFPLEVAIRAFEQTIHTNRGDSRLFPSVNILEKETVSMISDLMAHPEAVGNIVSGGTEANLLALLAAREQGKVKGIEKPEVIAGISAHFSIGKVANILGLTVKYAQLGTDYHVLIDEIKNLITPNTVAIIATAGSSELGIVDDIPEIANIAKSHNIYFHVDAASGGFIIPFARRLGYDLPRCDFTVDGVSSITIDPHKYGLSVIPSGCVLFRSKHIRNLIKFESHFVGTSNHTTFMGTWTGASIASVYAVIKLLGKQGFEEIMKRCFRNRSFFLELLNLNKIELFSKPELFIIAIKNDRPKAIMSMLQRKGWFVSVSKRYKAIRIVIHNHTTREHLEAFIKDYCSITNKKYNGQLNSNI